MSTPYAKRRLFSPYAAPRKRMKSAAAARPEVKQFIGNDFTQLAAGATTFRVLPASIPVGSAQGNRVSNKIRLKRVEVWGFFGSQAANATPITAALAHQHPSSLFNNLDVFGPFAYTDSADVLSAKLNDIGGGSQIFHFQKSYSGNGKIIKYDKDSATNIVSESCPSLLLTNNSAAASTGLGYYWCVWYTDA